MHLHLLHINCSQDKAEVCVCVSDDEDAEVRCKENLDLAVATDPSNAEAYHTLASYWLCKGDKQVQV